jgi:hypothetical protein
MAVAISFDFMADSPVGFGVVLDLRRRATGSLETMKALAAVFETDVATLGNGEQQMSDTTVMPNDEKEALEYVARLKGFYMHLFMYVVFAVGFLGMFGLKWGFGSPPVKLMLYAFAGWGLGLVFHALHAHEVIDFLSPKWERRMVERRLGRKLN